MPSRFSASRSFIDKAESISTVEVYVDEADAIAYIGDPTIGSNVKTLLDAIDAVTLANATKSGSGIVVTTIAPAAPTDDNAYNSSKLQVFFYDSVTGEKFTMTIPARNPLAYNTTPGTKNVILTAAAGGTAAIESLVTAINTHQRSKNGNTVVVTKIQIAGGKQS